MQSLPTFFDIVVVGTGFVESLIASACARSGLSVLHIDENNYFGSNWATLSLNKMEEWADQNTQNNEMYGYKCFKIIRNTKDTKYETMAIKGNRFSLDLTPRLIYSDSPFMDFIFQSSLQKSIELARVEGSCLLVQQSRHHTEFLEIPQSKDEIIHSPLSLSEKHDLLKIVNKVSLWDNSDLNAEFIDNLGNKPFSDFLKNKGLSDSLASSFLSFCMAGLQSSHSTSSFQALRLIKQYIQSLTVFPPQRGPGGVFYPPTAYVIPFFGMGEIAQSLVRIAAVWGGITIMGCKINKIIRPLTSQTDQQQIHKEDIPNTKALNETNQKSFQNEMNNLIGLELELIMDDREKEQLVEIKNEPKSEMNKKIVWTKHFISNLSSA
ncbi:MAG: hypothetical protein EZS28_011693 [Streblomastix strix]|uniref:Rab proteins geranylgeranyltransferase component A n=1 Tax=Streblomastix strix TaxID=222440 RepID=A0A5J4WE36_9EUKA|nr:MAG: hypothetical protein EZS28_011693 [Streblomastix strix]